MPKRDALLSSSSNRVLYASRLGPSSTPPALVRRLSSSVPLSPLKLGSQRGDVGPSLPLLPWSASTLYCFRLNSFLLSVFEYSLLSHPLWRTHSPPMTKDIQIVIHGSQSLYRSKNVGRCALAAVREKQGSKIRNDVHQATHAREWHSINIPVCPTTRHTPTQTSAAPRRNWTSLVSGQSFHLGDDGDVLVHPADNRADLPNMQSGLLADLVLDVVVPWSLAEERR